MTDEAARTRLSAQSVLESVVVHSVGAVCTRRARCELPGPPAPGERGPVRVWIEGLPVALFEHSLRGRVAVGPPGLRITDVRLDLEAALQRPEEMSGLRLDLEDAEDRQAEARERRDRISTEIQEVAAFRAVPPQPRRGDPPRWAPVESLLALAGFVDARLNLLQERLRTAEDELRRADHDVEVLRSRLELSSTALHTERTREYATAVLTLDGAAAADDADPPDPEAAGREADSTVEVELEYHVPGATWSPVYQLRLDRAPGARSEGSLVLRACVAQRTGEDWTGVRLGLSTADLLRRADLPELRSLRIGRRQAEPPGPGGWREPPAGLGELFAGYDAAVAAGSASGPAVVVGGGGSGVFPQPVPPPPAVPLAAPPPLAAGAAPAAAPALGGDEQGNHSEATLAHGYAAAAPGSGGASHPAGQEKLQQERLQEAFTALPPSQATRRRGGPTDTVQPGIVVEEPVPAPQGPPGELLDYARLTLAGPRDPGGRGRLRPAPSGPGAAVAEYRRHAESVTRLERPPHAVDVRRSAGSFDYRFDTAATVDVEADGAWHTVPVCEIPVETALEYVCVPAVDESVYGTVLLTNTSGHALLAGPADVTVDGEFVLTAPLPTLAPGERRRVGVGVVESVRVARRTQMYESTAGLRGGTTVLDHRIEVEIANRLPHRALVEVRERVPVTSDREIRIEERTAEPPWRPDDEPHDGRRVRGARVWRVELDPGRTGTLTGGYEIRVPAGKALVGGNRRS